MATSKPRGTAAKNARTAPSVAAGAVALPVPAPVPVKPELTAADRENPNKLSGEALRRLAHQRGIARSEADGMSDEKLRMQLGYIIARQYAEAD